jgi:DNA-binding SARP family transcriptional activator
VEISGGEWRREKARQLFQLLLVNRKTPVDREQITERLWPGLDPETAQRDFKVALSTLIRTLEPTRGKDEPSAYIFREGRLYGLRANADMVIDASEFERHIEAGDRLRSTHPAEALDSYRAALQMYPGNFLQEYLFEDWLAEERERLLALYLRSGDRLARSLAETCEWQELIVVCQALLARDNCWEEAYRLQMLAYDRLGNRAQALRIYRRCEQTLDAELAMPPSAPVRELWEALRRPNSG